MFTTLILEGSGVFVKKINRFIKLIMVSMLLLLPILKVKVVMTVSLSVRMYLTSVFGKISITFEQSYPKPSVEEKILVSTLKGVKADKEFCKKLVTWKVM